MAVAWLAIPNRGLIHPGAQNAVLQATRGDHIIHLDNVPGGSLTHNFNMKWINCYNHAKEFGITDFVMIHDDMSFEPWWLDTLIAERDRVGADVLSAAIAIKDQAGNTSTGLRFPGTWSVRRLTMAEVFGLPETFSGADCGDPERYLVLNTGCWIIRFDPEIWKAFPGFQGANKIWYYPDSDTMQAMFWSEDWEASSWFHEHGLKLFATRKIKIEHYGQAVFPNDRIWGHPYDLEAVIAPPSGKRKHLGGATLPTATTPNGDAASWCPPVWDYFLDMEGVKTVLDVGCGAGFAARYFEGQGCNVLGIEADKSAIACYQGKSLLEHDFSDGSPRIEEDYDLAWCCEVVEHVEAEHEQNVLDVLCRAKTIALTHATPGQEGTHHVNCQDPGYWVERIEARGYKIDERTTNQLRSLVNHGGAEGYHFARSGLVFRKAMA